jgi:hypothetical protein
MQKKRFDSTVPVTLTRDETWLDLERIAQVAVTSEDPDHPIESAFGHVPGPGWRASGRGTQTIRLIFDPPQRLRRILLRFVETDTERTQELSLRCWPDRDSWSREIVRQQWNFSPGGSTTEIEDYRVEVDRVAILELLINPDVSKGEAVATLTEWRIA